MSEIFDCPKNLDGCHRMNCRYPKCKTDKPQHRPVPPSGGSSGVKPPLTVDLTRAQIAELRARERLWTLIGNLTIILTPVLLEVGEKIREDLKKPD